MAKDPAFLFYYKDAASDVSHMNRLERGCYFDFVQAQKNFGPLSLESIQKVLGKDFNECWPALKMCLTCVNHMYFIEWLQESIEKRKKFSESRSKNRKGQKKDNLPQNEKTYVHHMAIANEIVIANVNEKEEGVGETILPLSDKWFATILDDIEVGNLRMTFRDKDVDQEIKTFKAKARAAPGQYQHRDKAGILLALHSQLRHAKKKNLNGTHSNTTAIIATGKHPGKL